MYDTVKGQCGGLLGLFSGFSILSVVEIIYYATLRLWYNKKSSKMNDNVKWTVLLQPLLIFILLLLYAVRYVIRAVLRVVRQVLFIVFVYHFYCWSILLLFVCMLVSNAKRIGVVNYWKSNYVTPSRCYLLYAGLYSMLIDKSWAASSHVG